MKIAILTSGILPVPAVQGGAVENLVDYYLEYNNKHHLHDITIYSVWHPGVKQHPAVNSDVNHYVYINMTSLWSKIKKKLYLYKHTDEYYDYHTEYFFEQAYNKLKKTKFDCIILENRPGYAYKLGERGLHNIVLHLHNDHLNHNTNHAHQIFNNINRIITVSNYIRNRVSTIENNKKIQTIHNGIDLSLFSNNSCNPISGRNKLGLKKNDFVMVFSGRINKDKGVSEVIDAMLNLKDYPNIKLLIIGSTFFGSNNNEDEYVHSLKEKAKKVKDRIIFTGFVPYNTMPDYLQLADIAIIPSVWDDPFPTTVLEAQAMGLPIITTRRGGIPEEVTEENALILTTDDYFVDNLTESIKTLYSDPERRIKMSQASLKYSKCYNKQRYAENFFRAISSIE